jgi:hypothetical protein
MACGLITTIGREPALQFLRSCAKRFRFLQVFVSDFNSGGRQIAFHFHSPNFADLLIWAGNGV